MPKVVVTAKVQDIDAWERGFRTHADLFKKQTVSRPIFFAAKDNEVTALFEPDNLETYLEILNGPDTAAAMEMDGIDRSTVKVAVLDNEWDLS